MQLVHSGHTDGAHLLGTPCTSELCNIASYLMHFVQYILRNRPISQLNSIQGNRCDSLFGKKSTSFHYVANTQTKRFHALLRAVHAF